MLDPQFEYVARELLNELPLHPVAVYREVFLLKRKGKARKHRAELANAIAQTLQTRKRSEWTCARFRDTFAVELLLDGVPIERVSLLLGHQSVRITEKHYAPQVRSRQEQLEADLVNAWSRDPLVLLQSGVAPEVHGKERPNNSFIFNKKDWCPGWESNPHEEKSPEDFKSSASAIPPPGQGR